MRKIQCVCLALLPVIGSAQQFSIGFTGGVPAEPAVGKSAKTMPFVIGPTLSVGRFGGFSFESGVFFHRLGATEEHYAFSSLQGALVAGSDVWKARAIEIPFLLKYRFLSRARTWRPFITAGPTVRRTSIDHRGVTSSFSGNPLSAAASVPATASETVKWNLDPAMGAGVSFRAGRVYIEPEVRYSYWGAGKHEVIRQNQVQFLFGLRF